MHPYLNHTDGSISPFIPGWGFDGRFLNLTTIMKHVRGLSFLEPGNNQLLDLHDDDLKAYSSSLKFYVKEAILQSSFFYLEVQLQNIWKQILEGFHSFTVIM